MPNVFVGMSFDVNMSKVIFISEKNNFYNTPILLDNFFLFEALKQLKCVFFAFNIYKLGLPVSVNST